MSPKPKYKINDEVNGWIILDRVSTGRYKFKCPTCDTTKICAPSLVKKMQYCGGCSSDSKFGKIYIGQTFGSWQVKEIINKSKLICLCQGCQKTKQVNRWDLQSGKSKSCRCQQRQYIKQTCLEKYGTHTTAILEDVKQKKEDTVFKKYGVDNSFKSDEIKQKIKKANLEKYGVEYATQSSLIREKIKGIVFERYGVESVSQSKVIRKKVEETCLLKYGTRTPFQSPVVVEKIKKANLEKYGVEYIAQLPERRNKLKEWCEQNPGFNGQSKSELELLNWIQQYYSDACKIKKEGNELDIFIPKLNLGIEYNGLFWHSEVFKEKQYHLEKTKFFERSSIRIIHIWEHEWHKNRQQVKSFLLSAMGCNQHKIGARKCKLIWSSSKEEITKAQELLEQTHIQGKAHHCKYVANVYYNNILVATATFGKHHRNSKNWVLSRFTTKTNYTIQGVLSKISKMASKQLQSDIFSWADYRLSQGSGYLRAGWKKEKLLPPDYFYHKNGRQVISKQSRQKRLVNTPRDMTEYQHAKLDGLERVWDCGKIRFRYNYLS